MVAMLHWTAGKPWHTVACAIYGASLILLYSASTLYHSLPVPPDKVERLRAFDQAAIYCLIAGTYTPICLVSLRGAWGWSLLAVVWTIALTAGVVRTVWRRFPDWLSFTLYFGMGYLCFVALGPMLRAMTGIGVGWLMFGGLLYTVGAVVLATDRPRLWPGRFGSHDLWHLFVLGGSATHFAVMRWFVLPAP
jgi:hemolysin III